MSRLEVLVTTMHQTDFCKFNQMQLRTDAVLANQTDKDGVVVTEKDGNRIILVSTPGRGVSRNRNIALAHANQHSEFVIFSDDDLVFDEGYEQKITDEFDRHPEVEAIKFNLHDLSSTRKISMKRIERFEKATRRNMASSGVWGLVIRTEIVKRRNLHFHENFGPGTDNFCGEDTIFVMELFDKKINVYRSPIEIAGIDQTDSSWFQGYNEQYFTTIGKVLRETYPWMAVLLAIRGAFRFSKRERCKMHFFDILKCYLKGICDR